MSSKKQGGRCLSTETRFWLTPPKCNSSVLLVLLTLAAVPAEAQLCAGRASFNLASTHFALDAGANGSGRGIGASVGHGTDALFAIVSGATHRVAGAGSVNVVAATLATDQPLSPDNK